MRAAGAAIAAPFVGVGVAAGFANRLVPHERRLLRADRGREGDRRLKEPRRPLGWRAGIQPDGRWCYHASGA